APRRGGVAGGRADPGVPGGLPRRARAPPATGLGGPVSSHGLGLADAIRLGWALDRMPGRLIVHAVEAGDLSQGAGLTPAVAAVIDTLAAAVLRDLRSQRSA